MSNQSHILDIKSDETDKNRVYYFQYIEMLHERLLYNGQSCIHVE